MSAADSPRWCENHQKWGDHHTDRCPQHGHRPPPPTPGCEHVARPVERTASGRVFTDADFERLATEAERDRYRDEVARLRCCIEAALERVELLDGGENDGYEAEAILRNALEGGPQ